MPEQDPARLTFVTGKGGVGKTSAAAGMARWAAINGERTLAVDVAASGRLQAAVGSLTAVGDLTVLDLTTEASIDEYVKLFLKVPIAPSSLPVLAGIFDFVSTAAPAVREILTVGKIGYEAVHGNWDRIIVDGPATGHIVELLTAPDDVRKLAPAGPLATQTGWLSEALASASTDVVVVAQPEELIVNETLELVERISVATDVALGAVVSNRIVPELGASSVDEASALVKGAGPLAAVASLLLAGQDRQRRHTAELIDMAQGADVPHIPVFENPDDPVAATSEAVEVSPWR